MRVRLSVLSLVGFLLSLSAGASEGPVPQVGAVFTMTDDATANAVLAFARASDGSLTFTGSFPTGGAGSGGGEGVLGSQGSVTLSQNGRFLFAVNAGSDEVSSFRVDGSRLTLAGVAPSGGLLPVSVTEHDGLVYVLNAGGTGNISGFTVDERGRISPMAGSSRPLSSGTSGAAQVSFDRSGDVLAVTEKAASAIALYVVRHDGRTTGPTTTPSSGATPFGFAFTGHDVLVVSEAGGGPGGTSAVSTYDVDGQTAEVVSGSVPDGQRAACWLTVTRNGHQAFVANAASGDISAYALDRRGDLMLLAGAAGVLPSGGKPLDVALTGDERYVFDLDAGNHTLVAFARHPDGTLDPLGAEVTGLPPQAVGIAVR
jgi:6-phosphogluconolactonase (cycloisomerase 2 family)